ncbi:MAG: ABC transporter substrate-binding protein [Tepidisphaeraceae bacterium]
MSFRTNLVGCLSAILALAVPLARGQDAIKLGHYGSLTGSEATFGTSTSNGVKLAIAELNANGGIDGKQVTLVEYDTKGDPREAGAVVTHLVNSDKVIGVIGEVASSLSLAGAPVCQQGGVPMITPSSTNPKVTLVGDYIFRVCFIDPFQGYVGAKFSVDTLHAKNAAILIDQSSAYAVGLADEFKKNFEKLGGTITTTQSYNKGDQDFSARLTAIRAGNPDVIYIPGYYTDVANIAVQARKLGITQPLVGGDGWDSEELAKNAGKAIEGCYYSNHAAPDDPSPVLQGFIAKYKDEYGAQPDALAALGYDAANVFFAALKQTHGEGGAKLRDALAATKNFGGVTGSINFNATRDAVKPAVVLTIKDGQPKFVTTIKPE